MRRRALLLWPAVAVLARCASPDPALYTLRAVPGVAEGGGPASVKVARPGLAGYLDRSEIVRDSSSNRLLLSGGERWGEPLGDMIGRVLALDLSQRLPGSSVFTEAGPISADAAAAVEVDIQRFDLDSSGAVALVAQIAVHPSSGARSTAARLLRLTASPAGPGTPELVSAMSAALGQLADQIAGALRTLPLAPS